MGRNNVLSSAEVSRHSTKEDCWVVIAGKVYDLTKFLDEHPGGEVVLLEASAKGDATEAFKEVGHSEMATSLMPCYLIGTLEGHGGVQQGLMAADEEEEQAEGIYARNTTTEKMTGSSSSTDLLLPLLIICIAFGAWYFYSRANP